MSNISYDTGQVCLNGHLITSSYHDYPEFNQDFCSDCGESTIISCPKCSTEIQGSYRDSMSISALIPPKFCHKCGNPYPWTQRAIEVAQQLADELDGLIDSDIVQIKESLPDLVKAGPQSILAEKRFKKSMSKASKESNEAMKAILEGIVSEQIKTSLFGG